MGSPRVGRVERVLELLQERRDRSVAAHSERVGDLEDVAGGDVAEREDDVQPLLVVRQPVAALPVRQRPDRYAEVCAEVVLGPLEL